MSYIGIPPFGQTIRTITNATATASQTTFNITGGYIVGYVDVYLNGVLLTPSDYTATDGLTVVLGTGAALNDEFQAISYQPVSLTNVLPSTGGTVSGNVTITGDLTVDTNTLYVDSTNNRVGIGTTSPGDVLHVSKDSTSLIGIRVQNTNASGQAAVSYYNNSGTQKADVWWNNSDSSLYLRTLSTDPIKFSTNNTERMRIDSSGNVGIGTSSPASNLQVVGAVQDQIRFGTSTSVYTDLWMGTGFTVFDSIGGSSGGFDFRDDGTSRMHINSSGNVGIGTTSPSTPLHTYTASGENKLTVEAGATSQSATVSLVTNATTPGQAILYMGKSGASTNGQVGYDPNNNFLYIYTNNTERMRIDSSGNVGIGTTSPAQILEVKQLDQNAFKGIRINNPNAFVGSAGIEFQVDATYCKAAIFQKRNYANGGGDLIFAVDSSSDASNWVEADEKMRIDINGNVGIGTTSPTSFGDGNTKLAVVSNTSGTADVNIRWGTNAVKGILYCNDVSGAGIGIGSTTSTYLGFLSNGIERMRINSSGRLLLGTTSDGTGNPQLRVTGGSNRIAIGAGEGMTIISTGQDNFSMRTWTNTPNPNFDIGFGNGSGGLDNTKQYLLANAGTWYFYNSNLSISGNLSKGSGSFKINHPLPEKEETHNLVHSFIEGPQADLIYRGRATLVDGTATVNIDEASGMTDGTFVLLCRDVQCFTTNESDWTAVRGSVSGNLLTLEAQDNTSTASISWMVIGERQDKHMYDTEWTDENGKVIVEPLKAENDVLATRTN